MCSQHVVDTSNFVAAPLIHSAVYRVNVPYQSHALRVMYMLCPLSGIAENRLLNHSTRERANPQRSPLGLRTQALV